MIVVERAAGELVRIGSYTLQVLEVHPDGVVVALLGPGEEPPARPDAAHGDDRKRQEGPSSSVSAPAP